nr:rho gtpase-activating protein rgd1 [Quercus suber]
MSGEYNREEDNGDAVNHYNDTSLPSSPAAPAVLAPQDVDHNGAGSTPKTVGDVMSSDIGINTLLARLKQSIASARDFATFLKKRSSLEEEQAQGLKRLCKAQLDTVKRQESRSGTYAQHVVEMLDTHNRMGDNGMQFALSLHQMHEDLTELSNSMERGRKHWKHDGLDAEKKASDAEAAMQKAKSRYDSLAEDYDRAKTGDTKGSRRIGLKGPKSAEQHESDLLRKVQAADADYEEKVKLAQSQRESLLKEGRPNAVRALRELCRECDSGLTLQLQKFASFNEKLLLGNGLAVTPLTDKDAAGGQRSMRDCIYDIDNEKDFNTYVSGHYGKVTRPSEIQYERHPTLMSRTQQPTSRNVSSNLPTQGLQAPPSSDPLIINTAVPASQPGSTASRFTNLQSPPNLTTSQPPQSVNQSSPSTFSPQGYAPYTQQQPTSNYNNYSQQPTRDGYANTPPYPVHPSERAGYPQQTAGSSPSAGRQMSAPPRPVFGVSLQDLFNRDQTAVPIVIEQCILAVDHFGLEVEGIYRVSGNQSHVSALREAFNKASATGQSVDFRIPSAFYQDVNSVTTLMKQFFRDLPDPLFTRAHYDYFIAAAKLEDENARRDALHQSINDLPDPNYATLRALVLHMHRVMQRESQNRMGANNLGLCFAPSLMGTHTSAQIADAGWQARVLETILNNATAIFDED